MKKLFFICFIIFSLLIIGGKEYRCEQKDDSFNKVEDYILNQYEFIQNGIKLEYTIKCDIDNEFDRIYEIFKCKSNLEITKGENYISAKGENINYSVNIYDYNDLAKVEIIVINLNNNILQSDLKALAEEIKNDNFINQRYFSFIKAKIEKDSENTFKDLESKLKIDIKENINISNGIIAKAKMIDKTSLNIGQITYDTGSYLIIGTPIIFITY